MKRYSIYAVTPKNQMLGPIFFVDADCDSLALDKAGEITDELLGAKVLDGLREVGVLPPRKISPKQ